MACVSSSKRHGLSHWAISTRSNSWSSGPGLPSPRLTTVRTIDRHCYNAGRKADGVPFDQIDLGSISAVITGPHASALFASELSPFVDKQLTRRQQFDFSDAATKEVGRATVVCHLHYIPTYILATPQQHPTTL